MGDQVHMPGSNKNFQTSSKRLSKPCIVASSPRFTFNNTVKHLKHIRLGVGPTEQAVLFLLKVAALEMARRFSRRRCPFVWHALQSLQLLTYPPFKWIQRWAPLRNFVKGIQVFSRPLLFLSVATAFSDISDSCKKISDDVDDSQPFSESATVQSTSDERISEEAFESVASDNWLLQLRRDLEEQGVTLPERINDDELHRFYIAANGDFSCLLQSIKRTIRWRETYTILSSQELEMWSHLVFWHGIDMAHRPCLVIRFGLACSSVVPHDRPRFAQAIVSQMEHGVLYLVNRDDPRMTVLMDCEGLSPFRFPMHMMRSCSALMQAHYPNRLATLFVIRLPPVVRVLAQTVIQILKPTTRAKLRIEGENFQEVLSKVLQSVPSFLHGKCSCEKCSEPFPTNSRRQLEETSNREPSGNISVDEVDGPPYETTTYHPAGGSNYEQVLRSAVAGILMLWIFIAFLSGMHVSENLSLSAS